ncbi:DUF475 domain-containing protein [Candidatus Nomurabacteria bacterium]|nr:DUF475 domain-containing protein [Candidatus Kaiserbacteria bacterium]MCB9814664.1 DUF475 domain-containing protein [Candidatus Nomurabacteria bacterium]
MKNPMSYFYGSFASLLVALPFGYWVMGWSGVWVVTVLAVLETSLSLDNAVVNAKVLDGWDSTWRRIFLWVGLPIAVFGMRLVFPILIVSLTTGLGMTEAFQLALHKPDEYEHALTSAHHEVAAFGGSFLMMVALQFFFDDEKDVHWLKPLEQAFAKLGKYEVALEAGITMLVLMIAASLLHGHEKAEFVVAGVYGFITYITTKAVGQLLSGDNEDTGKKVAQGVGGMLYLEVLDASFSFDGVIGAFAISNNLLLILAGLGVGAMFVRSFTIYLVDKGTLGKYQYLEHGAFWAIAALAVIMFVGVEIEIPETITGFIGAGFIGIAFWSSVRANKKTEAEKVEAEIVPEKV